MIVKSHTALLMAAYFLVLSGFAVHLFIIEPSGWWWAAALEAFVLLATVLLYRYRKKREIRYRSDDTGVLVVGSKEGLYDPDYIRYDELRSAVREGRQIVLTKADGTVVRLDGLRKHSDAIVAELRTRLTRQTGRDQPVGGR